MKKVLGLDLGTNSIGWALINKDDEERTGKIIKAGSRIIPMSQDVLGKFDSGVSISQTAERTGYRGIRRLRERHLLRRERLHRVLNILGFLPKHYAEKIDFEKHPGQFVPETEPKLVYAVNSETNKADFLFKKSFEEMLTDFAAHQPQLLEGGKKIPYDWTIYYLRKKALKHKIEKEELSWLLLHFNQKRGYYQREGTDAIDKATEICSLKILDVAKKEKDKKSEKFWYEVILENGWIYKTTSYFPLKHWIGNTIEFIVTKEINTDNSIKKTKEGEDKVHLSILPSFEEIEKMSEKEKHKIYQKIKIKTEAEIERTTKTVGEYIYDTLLQNPSQKIRGKLVRTIERKFYKNELRQILETQQKLHPELQNKNLYRKCIEELYEHNEAHRNGIGQKDFTYLFLNDIIFYQRPLKSKKSLVSNCKFETRVFIKDGKKEVVPLKCIAKSNPLFQEFRLLKFLQNIRIYQKEKEIDGKLQTDVDVTCEFLKTTEDWTNLFDWLNNHKEIDQKAFLKYPSFGIKRNISNYRWNYVEDKTYPCNETRSLISGRLNKAKSVSEKFLTRQNEEELWHILYSVEDKTDIEKAIKTFASKKELGADFIEQFKKFPPFKKDYGSYSAKAIKKLLPLMRTGRYWSENNIHPQTKERIDKIIAGEYDEKIRDRVREKSLHLTQIDQFQGLPEWLASYIVYDRHSEEENTIKWKIPGDIKLLEQHSLRNPIVEQVINETLQVVKDIWKEYGNSKEDFFDEIHVELGREMKNPKSDREKITKQITENENTNLRIKSLLMEMLNDPAMRNVRPHSLAQQEILKIYEEGALNYKNENIPEEILKISKQAQPTQPELSRYKLWLQQKYRSPYTGNIIPLNKLFTPAYEIEHIIPQSRYFDDSFNNKVICESAVNKLKDNYTAYEFILHEGGRMLETGLGETTKVFTKEEYENFVKTHYLKNQGKIKRLLMEEIPDSFIQRQLNDTRYISKVVKNLMSNIVRKSDEQEAISKNVIVSNGTITSTLKRDWGLNDIWNEIIAPRFERLNELTKTQNFGEWINREGKHIFQTQVPIEQQKGFSKKRIDHRHHALDAIVIACTSRDHANYLNNQSSLGSNSREEKDKKRYDLRHKLSFKKYNDGKNQNYKWVFHKPWNTFVKDTKDILNTTIVSFKQNQRIINKAINRYQKWIKDDKGNLTKKIVSQKGNNWAIRKPMHTPMPYGKRKYNFDILKIAENVGKRKAIIDAVIKTIVIEAFQNNKNKVSTTQAWLKKNPISGNEETPLLVTAFAIETEKFRKRQPISKLSNRGQGGIKTIEDAIKFINKVADYKLNQELLRHLKENDSDINKAFNADGIERFNSKRKIPVYNLPIAESGAKRFPLGTSIGTKHKWMEAAEGTNLFFAIYEDKNGKRNYETIPLNIVIEREKQNLPPVSERNEMEDKLLTYLSPNDLVYLPDPDEEENIRLINFEALNQEQIKRIYRFVSCTGNEGHFVPHSYSKEIIKNEIGPNNKSQNSLEGTQIKMHCIKIKVNRLGNIRPGSSSTYGVDKREPESIVTEPIPSYSNRGSVKAFKSFDEMENDQLKYFSSQNPESLLRNLRTMILAAFGLKDEASFAAMPRVINFKKEA